MRIDNLDVLCRNVDVMVDFYEGVLGLDHFLPYEPDQGWAAFQAGDVTIYIFETDVTERPPRRTVETEKNQPGIDSFAFAVDDLDSVITEFDDKVEWCGETELWEHPSGTWYRHRAFYDPEGNLLHFTQPHKAKPA